MAGWIKIHREITKHWIFQDAEKFKWWIDLLLTASHEDNKHLVGDRLIEVKRGQMVVSLSFLAKRWSTSKRTVLRFLTLLESDGMCNRLTHQKMTILTICNYDSYQEVDKSKVTDDDTDKYPIGNRSVTELKNVEECKEYNITTTARTREDVEWNESVENGYLERFKAQGCAREAMRITGKSLSEVMNLLDIYRAKRKLQNRGHIDFTQFCNLFVWHLENRKLTIPTASQTNGLSGQALLDRIK